MFRNSRLKAGLKTLNNLDYRVVMFIASKFQLFSSYKHDASDEADKTIISISKHALKNKTLLLLLCFRFHVRTFSL